MVLTDDREVRELNKQYRDRDEPTDVLSFSMSEGEGAEFVGDLLGDIVISVDTAQRQMVAANHRERLGAEMPSWSLEDELVFLTIHGLLHLLGHDHHEPQAESAMRAEERRLWQAQRT